MLNVEALIYELTRIRDMIDHIEVRGAENAKYLVQAFDNCENLIGQLNGIMNEVRKKQSEQDDESGERPKLEEVK